MKIYVYLSLLLLTALPAEAEDWPSDWNAIREYRTLPYTLKNRGYQTSLIGKWHLGRPQPPDEWFDY